MKRQYLSDPSCCQIRAQHISPCLAVVTGFLHSVEQIQQYANDQWNHPNHATLVASMVEQCERHLQDVIVEIEELSRQGVDVSGCDVM